MKTYRNVALSMLIFMTTMTVFICCYYNYMLLPVSKSNEIKEIAIESGTSTQGIAELLKSEKLIKSSKIFMLYLKINKINSLKATKYQLSPNMGAKKIASTLEKGNNYNAKEVRITFKEGINIKKIAKLISESTVHEESEVYDLLKNKEYINSLIAKYWFLTDDIKNSQIYYPLEGYLFPETYAFSDKEVSIKEIFTKMLSETNKKLSSYQKDIEASNLSIHEIMTLASIIELEGANSNDREGVAGVFYNRLNDSWSLGSDVTTYYAFQVEMSERDLYQKELNNCETGYNTRCNSYIGLPVGPISNPSIESIKATIKPKKHEYYYFVADKNKQTYFSKTGAEHQTTIETLKKSGLWYTY